MVQSKERSPEKLGETDTGEKKIKKIKGSTSDIVKSLTSLEKKDIQLTKLTSKSELTFDGISDNYNIFLLNINHLDRAKEFLSINGYIVNEIRTGIFEIKSNKYDTSFSPLDVKNIISRKKKKKIVLRRENMDYFFIGEDGVEIEIEIGDILHVQNVNELLDIFLQKEEELKLIGKNDTEINDTLSTLEVIYSKTGGILSDKEYNTLNNNSEIINIEIGTVIPFGQIERGPDSFVKNLIHEYDGSGNKIGEIDNTIKLSDTINTPNKETSLNVPSFKDTKDNFIGTKEEFLKEIIYYLSLGIDDINYITENVEKYYGEIRKDNKHLITPEYLIYMKDLLSNIDGDFFIEQLKALDKELGLDESIPKRSHFLSPPYLELNNVIVDFDLQNSYEKTKKTFNIIFNKYKEDLSKAGLGISDFNIELSIDNINNKVKLKGYIGGAPIYYYKIQVLEVELNRVDFINTFPYLTLYLDIFVIISRITSNKLEMKKDI